MAKDNLHCPICSKVFKDRVVLPCSHSVCHACVQQWWEEKGDGLCPVCWKKPKLLDPPSNLSLRYVSKTRSQASVASNDICSLHKKKLTRFCLDHQQLVCLSCSKAKTHAGHKIQPINKVVKGHKEKLQEGLQDAKKRLDCYNEIILEYHDQAKYIKDQRAQVENKIKKDFKELCRILQDEEDDRLSAVREEAQKKSRRIKEKLKALQKVKDALLAVIKSTEKQQKSAKVSFMKNFKSAMTRIQKLPDKPELLPGALLDQAKHVGNLKFSLMEKMVMKVSYSPVILDPNTARSELSLFEDLTSVSFGKWEKCPSNLERFKRCNVLGSALASGTHMWDVEVGDNNDWEVGVAWGDPCLPDDMRRRSIAFREGEYKACDGAFGSWNPPVKLQMIRVHLDTTESSVSFSDALKKSELCKTNFPTQPPLSGNMKMFPFFRTRDEYPLKIIPLSACVVTSRQ